MPARSDAHLQSTQQWQWAGLDNRVVGTVLTVVLVVGLGYYLFRPLYHSWRNWRAESLAALSLQQLQERQLYRSQRTALEAYMTSPSYVPALRLLAQRASQTSPQEALQLYQRIMRLPRATTEDARSAIRLAMQLRRQDIALPLLDTLLLAEPTNIANLDLATNLALARADQEAAIAYARRATLLQPSNPDVQFLLARCLYSQPESREEARQILLDVSAGLSELSLQALTELANDPQLSPPDRQLVLRRLRQHPKSEFRHELLSLLLKMQELPSELRLSYLNQRLADLQPSDDDLLTLGRWLNALRLPQETLRWLPESKARQRADWFLLYLDALALQGRLRQLLALLDEDDLPLREAQIALFRARVANELKDPQVELLWNDVLQAARRDPESQFWLSQQLERIGQPDLAVILYREMTRHPATTRVGFLNLLRYYEQRRSTEGIAQTLQQMARLYPDDPSLQQQAIYYQLLLRDSPQEYLDELEQLVRTAPQQWANRATLALAYLKLDRPGDALQLFQNKSFNLNSFRPGWRAVYAACLWANGRPDEFHNILDSINLQTLSDPEVALLQPGML